MNKTEYLLTCLIEEATEVQKAATKALRFGLSDGYPGTDRTNLSDICNELNDFFAVVEMVYPIIGWKVDSEKVKAKKRKVLEFMNYSERIGSLKE